MRNDEKALCYSENVMLQRCCGNNNNLAIVEAPAFKFRSCTETRQLAVNDQSSFTTLPSPPPAMAAFPLIASLPAINSSRSGGSCKYTGQSVRALPIRIMTVGKKRTRGVQLLVDEYTDKLSYYSSVEDVHLRSNPRNAHDVKIQIQDEDKAMMNLITADDWVVMLDEEGADITSEQMAELIGDAGMMKTRLEMFFKQGASRLSFCIGGPYGHGKGLRQRANKSVRLSSLVLNHEIALVVLVEQLYRSWTILKGQKYHH